MQIVGYVAESKPQPWK